MSTGDCVAPDDTGLAMDCACFTFLVIQYRVFTSDYFKHVVRDHREQSDMASRYVSLCSFMIVMNLEKKSMHRWGIYNFGYNSEDQFSLRAVHFLPRGAELVDEHVRAQLEAVRREDKGKMDRIKKS